MTLLYNNIAVFDFETSSTDPKTTQPLSLACVMVDPLKLKILPNSEFYTLIKPEDEKTVEAEALKVNKLTIAELNEKGVDLEIAWSNFHNYLQQYRKGKTKQSKIIPSGFNICNFDLVIYERLNERFKKSDVFNETKSLDLFHDFYRWWHNEEIIYMNMGEIRKRLGMSLEGAHNSLVDVRDCARILLKMLNLYRTVKPRFQNAFADAT